MKGAVDAKIPTSLKKLDSTATQMDDPKQVSLRFRDELLAYNWPDDIRVAELIGPPTIGDPTEYVRSLRIDRRLLGVWSIANCRYVHPAFQFDARGHIRPAVAELLKVLSVNDDPGGWRRAFWLYSPHSYLEGETPADIFENDAQRVIEVAQHEFEQDTDAFW